MGVLLTNALLSEADKARLGLPSQLATLTPVSIVAIQAPSTGEGAVFEQEEFSAE